LECGLDCLDAGLGLFKFAFGETANLYALHESVGEPVAQLCGGIDIYTHLILFAETSRNGLEVLQSFCDKLILDSEKSKEGTFSIFRWNVRHGYWRREVRATSRPIESVVLPSDVKGKLLEDIGDFLKSSTQCWYRAHGIPHRRSYLFHGVPGAGKTSLLQSIAGRFERNLCYLQPSHPDMTDDGLKSAVQNAPSSSLIVLEDVDALFTKDREVKVAKSNLTFSGLLNALDGVGSSTGQIIVLTTNFRENLDAALIRPGRVDHQVEFGYASHEQMRQLFMQFYPKASVDDARLFADKTTEALDGRNVSMAALQHFFIVSRRRTAQEAIASVGDIPHELEARDKEASFKAGEKGKDDEKAHQEQSEDAGGDTDKCKKASKTKKGRATASTSAPPASGNEGGIHIHVHTAPAASSRLVHDADDEANEE